MKHIFLLPCIYGVGGYKNGKTIFCLVKNSGKIQINSQKNKQKTKLFDIYLVRGFYFLFFGLLKTIQNLFEFNQMYAADNGVIKGAKKSLNLPLKNILFFFIVCFGVIISWIVLGIIPIKLSFYVLPKTFNLFLKRLTIGIIKCLIIYIFLLIIKFVKLFNQYYKFNSAIKEYQNQNNQVNFLTYFLCSIFLCVMVTSIFGIVANAWYAPIINAIISLCVLGVNYEFFRELQKTKAGKYIITPFYFLIDEKPSQTEQKCVKIVLKELEQGNNIMTNEKIDDGKIAFSESYVFTKEKLEKAGRFEKSDLDFIYCEVLNKNRAELRLIKEITKEQNKQVLKVVEKRARGEPITKIFGKANFYGYDFKVTKDVLSPRMETELLVEQVIKECSPKTKVLDIGTGSGAIAITIAKESGAKVTAVDISEKALQVAKQNAKNLEVKVTFKKSDLFLGLSKLARFDLIVSNPPYIPSGDIENLDEEVKNYDPPLALDGGKSGLDFYNKIIAEAPSKLKPNGKIFFEVGINQAKDIKKLLQKNFKDIRIVKDYNKIDRIVIATCN